MGKASIEFVDKPDGSVEMTFVTEPQLALAGGAQICAYYLAKRGLTKRDTEAINFPLYFGIRVKDKQNAS